MKLAPASAERAITILSTLLCLALEHGHEPRETEKGLALVVNGEFIPFGIEEQSQKSPHEPTAEERKLQQQRARWGCANSPWPKYDRVPTSRLAIVINANPYSGLRRTYADGRSQRIEEMLHEVVGGFAEHAALIRERHHAEEERLREQREREAGRQRQQAFEAREKGRMQFADAIHEQLAQRDRLASVLRHLESSSREEVERVQSMVDWLGRRIRQIDALLCPRFLELSARVAKVSFKEPPPTRQL